MLVLIIFYGNEVKPTAQVTPEYYCRAQCTLADPEKVSVALTDVAKHLGNLKYIVWEKMLGTVQYIEVGDVSWVVGVAKESISRKEDFTLSPAGGVWSIQQYKGKYTAQSFQPTVLTVQRKLQRVRVQLDWDRGKVLFSDPSNNTPLYTFKHSFTERLWSSHPFQQPWELVQYCRDKGIVFEGYCPLAKGEALTHPKILHLAGKYGRTPCPDLHPLEHTERHRYHPKVHQEGTGSGRTARCLGSVWKPEMWRR
ncbi:hypothetical protein SKAU_G00313390 [Synaphobranchus kaupii]|uniref:B30.2/SPRY domain-containing protein n=1 Tax=Synaphobranchus kaupii TaxID=118154 RepID=A0A9Q1ES43_SYNKA|nr:hypothetical protein SKAU_G00313390 [Synaphobranchus kaupii]